MTVASAREHLVFKRGEWLYAVVAIETAEIVAISAITPVPGAQSFVAGIVSHRSEVLPIIDVPLLLGETVTEAPRRLVVVRSGKGAVAFLAAKVIGMSAVDVDPSPFGTGAQAFVSRARGPVGECAVVDAEGLLGFLSSGSTAQ
jgi:chemotaxis signal transduction protein